MRRLTLNLMGCGRVGKTLARAWHLAEALDVQDVLTSTPDSAKAAVQWVGAGRACTQLKGMRAADLWMIAVPDRLIEQTAQDLAAQHPTAPDTAMAPTVFHCSGALSAQILAPLRALGWRVASAHCILSFADPAQALQQLPGTPCGLEGDPPATQQLAPLFSSIGLKCFDVSADNKLLYHAAAVFATNFVPVLQAVAEQLWLDSGVPEELLPTLRATLLQNAVHNLQAMGPQGALTGPAARGDVALVTQQAAALQAWDARSAQAYQAMSDLATRLASTGHIKAG